MHIFVAGTSLWQAHLGGRHILVAGTSWWQAGLLTTHLNGRQFLSLSNYLDSRNDDKKKKNQSTQFSYGHNIPSKSCREQSVISVMLC